MAPSMQVGTQFVQIFEDDTQTQKRSAIKFNDNASVTMTSGDTDTSIRISNIANPVENTDVANKAYVDATAQGLTFKTPDHVCRGTGR